MSRRRNERVGCTVTASLPVPGLIFLALLALKITGTAELSWWMVTAPLWLVLCLGLASWAIAVLRGGR